ncbi:MAG: pyridoxine 5'-phosphate synthase [Phycisphaerales bacterium]|nr:pyridoxine 5'-phosphate synthase [Phycisphaerales bacterium]
MVELGVNVDHIATVRQARRQIEPDPVQAALEAQRAGAEGITCHLREDRRHINDQDVRRLAEAIDVKLNFEMAATSEMVAIAHEIRPQMTMLVPESRQELTTEGGLDVYGLQSQLLPIIQSLTGEGIMVSAFVDAQQEQIEAAAKVGFSVCEIHTGGYAEVFLTEPSAHRTDALAQVIEEIQQAGKWIQEAGMRFNAGHGLTHANVAPIAAMPGLAELHIGHSIVSRSLFVGMFESVAEMKREIDKAVNQ